MINYRIEVIIGKTKCLKTEHNSDVESCVLGKKVTFSDAHGYTEQRLYGYTVWDLETGRMSHMAPYSLYSALLLTRVVHYLGNRVPFGVT
jgi:hypothetical protein